MESVQVACQKHWMLKLVLSKQCTWRRCSGNLETPLVRKLLTFFTCQYVAPFGNGHCMMWPLILVLHGPCPWHGHQFHWSWCHWSWCPWSGAWSSPPCSWWSAGGGHGPKKCGPIPMKDRTHGLPHLVHVVLSWVLLHHMHWHCNVVPIDGSLAHTTWTSLWLLVALASLVWSSMGWHLACWLLGCFPLQSISHGCQSWWLEWFWKAHSSAGLALKLDFVKLHLQQENMKALCATSPKQLPHVTNKRQC